MFWSTLYLAMEVLHSGEKEKETSELELVMYSNNELGRFLTCRENIKVS